MSVLVDTNLLLRSIQPDHSQYKSATDAIASLRRTDRLYIASQNLYELWAVCTRPPDKNGLGLSAEVAAAELDKLQHFFNRLPDRDEIYDEWRRLVILHDVKGKNAHDTRLVAAMNINGIEKILTFNRQDFIRFTNIEVITP
jgi:predicted nucleic acid-binding protein